MRYHYEPKNQTRQHYGVVYICDHPVYDRCTLFRIGERGLAVIQQRRNENKMIFWTEIDDTLNDEIYLHPGFKRYFDERAALPENGLYPTVTIRQIMWALRMKPLPKERWETVIDRKFA